MGNCKSCNGTHVASQVTTTKLILQDGKLEEFAFPIRVSQLMYTNKVSPNCFICSADEIRCNNTVKGVRNEEFLIAGQLYFALPVSALRRPLMAEDIAALAVRGNSALKCGDKSVFGKELVFKEVEDKRLSSSSRSGKWTTDLKCIPE